MRLQLTPPAMHSSAAVELRTPQTCKGSGATHLLQHRPHDPQLLAQLPLVHLRALAPLLVHLLVVLHLDEQLAGDVQKLLQQGVRGEGWQKRGGGVIGG